MTANVALTLENAVLQTPQPKMTDMVSNVRPSKARLDTLDTKSNDVNTDCVYYMIRHLICQ